MSWFDKLMPSRINTEKRRRSVPEGLWVKCEGCSAQLYRAELKRNLYVCPKCKHHLAVGARERLALFLDPGSEEELASNLEPVDPLKFRDAKRYRDRLAQAQKDTEERDALVVMAGALRGLPIVAAAFEFRFMAGSMGSVVGERFARGVSHAVEQRRPFVCFSASGGARMQEALYSLLQMAKTSAALAALAEAGLPYVSVMTNPTTGGVSASLAFLGDVNIAEPGSLIGFAGPRVIEQTVGEILPDGFQRAEFLLEKGALDMIVDRRRMREEIAGLLAKLTGLAAARGRAAAEDGELRPDEEEAAARPQAAEPASAEAGRGATAEAAAPAEAAEPVAAPAAEAAEPRKKAKAQKPSKAAKAAKAAAAARVYEATESGAAEPAGGLEPARRPAAGPSPKPAPGPQASERDRAARQSRSVEPGADVAGVGPAPAAGVPAEPKGLDGGGRPASAPPLDAETREMLEAGERREDVDSRPRIADAPAETEAEAETESEAETAEPSAESSGRTPAGEPPEH